MHATRRNCSKQKCVRAVRAKEEHPHRALPGMRAAFRRARRARERLFPSMATPSKETKPQSETEVGAAALPRTFSGMVSTFGKPPVPRPQAAAAKERVHAKRMQVQWLQKTQRRRNSSLHRDGTTSPTGGRQMSRSLTSRSRGASALDECTAQEDSRVTQMRWLESRVATMLSSLRSNSSSSLRRSESGLSRRDDEAAAGAVSSTLTPKVEAPGAGDESGEPPRTESWMMRTFGPPPAPWPRSPSAKAAVKAKKERVAWLTSTQRRHAHGVSMGGFTRSRELELQAATGDATTTITTRDRSSTRARQPIRHPLPNDDSRSHQMRWLERMLSRRSTPSSRRSEAEGGD